MLALIPDFEFLQGKDIPDTRTKMSKALAASYADSAVTGCSKSAILKYHLLIPTEGCGIDD